MCPDVSVIIPCYNHAHYLNYALESVLAQTYNYWEAIVVDDGSSDNTPEVTAQFKDPRIRYIYQDNQGLSSARNTGIYTSQAEAIALLDADDVWDADYLEKLLPTLESNPKAAAVYCGYNYIDCDGNIIGSPVQKVVPPDEFYKFLVNRGNWLIPSAVIFRKKIAEKEGYFDESLQAVEDTDLWIKISGNNPFVGVPQTLVRYRQHGSNMSSDPQRMIAAYYQILERDHGPPEGDPSAWSEEKKDEYTEYFRSASTRYLAFGDFELSAYYFLRMHEINPEVGNELGLWRSLARAHLPIEIRPEPNPLKWERSEMDVRGLLSELEKINPDSPRLEKHYSKIVAGAYLAFADEAFRANDARRAFKWFWKASKQHLGLVLSRPYWGTLARGVTRVG